MHLTATHARRTTAREGAAFEDAAMCDTTVTYNQPETKH